MIIDTSALIAILRGEKDAPDLARTLASADEPKRLSAANYVEVGIVIDAARDEAASEKVDDLIHTAGIVVQAVSPEQAVIARAAYRAFGKGSGHPARLNFGDCLAYALAKACNEPLLFKGQDFTLTDVARARLTLRG